MPSKRSRSKEREWKRRAREKMSDEKLKEERIKAKEGMKSLRNRKSREENEEGLALKQNKPARDDWYERLGARSKATMKEKRAGQTEDERNSDKAELRERMKICRAKRTIEEQEEARKNAREDMRELYKNKSKEENEYKKIFKKHEMRDSRAQLSGKEHLLWNLAAKKGMRKLKEEGRLHDFQKRSTHNITEMSDCKNFMQKGKSYSDFLSKAKPDIVERLNFEIREEKERERTRKEEERKKDIEGHWNFNAESGEYYWTGKNEPDYGDTFSCSPLTEEEKKLRKTAENREY